MVPSTPCPGWAALPVALLLVAGGLVALDGALGLLRLEPAHHRPGHHRHAQHSCILVASIIHFSISRSRPGAASAADRRLQVLMARTVVSMLLMRAAVYRRPARPPRRRPGRGRSAAVAGRLTRSAVGRLAPKPMKQARRRRRWRWPTGAAGAEAVASQVPEVGATVGHVTAGRTTQDQEGSSAGVHIARRNELDEEEHVEQIAFGVHQADQGRTRNGWGDAEGDTSTGGAASPAPRPRSAARSN